jgi:hypothetical protein
MRDEAIQHGSTGTSQAAADDTLVQRGTPDTPDTPTRLRRAERWLIPAAILGLLIVGGLGWQWVRFARPELVRDGVVTLAEAGFWARSDALRGLTIAQAAEALDGRVEPIGNGMTGARVPVQPAPGQSGQPWLELTIDAGRVSAVKLHR